MDIKPAHHDFRIDTWTPETLPMARLVDYLAGLAQLYGHENQVHFFGVRKGSVVAETLVDYEAIDEVTTRLNLIGRPDGNPDANSAYKKINQLLREDGASAVLRNHKGAQIIRFPGSKAPVTEEIVLHEHGELDGVVIRVGGKDDSVPVWLQGEDREIYKCSTHRGLARELAGYLFDKTIRVAGHGKWKRTSEGLWEMDSFKIQSWQALDERPLTEVLSELRAVEGSGWNSIDNPQEELRKLREA
jgi:hypothetical protein